MAGQLPSGEAVPSDGALPECARSGVGDRPFGVYVHVPFCAVRCGYCDFNTYTPDEVGGIDARRRYIAAATREVALAAGVLGDRRPTVSTVFFGGGTPSLLGARPLAELLRAVRDHFPFSADTEITLEANPETVAPPLLAGLHDTGFTRISLGMQSVRPHVLAVLDRVHTPGAALSAVAQARDAGFAHVSLDLIYGTPGESDDDWRASLGAALASGADHVSAYALVVEGGTALARRVRAGTVPPVDDDVLARRYELADAVLTGGGLSWYEVSNWARSAADRCAHNLLYWRSDNWWGVGPGAHSHISGVRWWNERRPETYAARLESGLSPGAGREVLDVATRRREDVMLRIRLAEGLPLEAVPGLLHAEGPSSAERLGGPGLLDRWLADGLVGPECVAAGRLVLTRKGRLLADGIVRDLWQRMEEGFEN